MLKIVLQVLKCTVIVLGAVSALIGTVTESQDKPTGKFTLPDTTVTRPGTDVKLGAFPDFSIPRIVSPASGISSFQLELFMSQIGANLPDFFEHFAREPMREGEDDFRTSVLRSIFCSSPRPVQFAMFALPLAQNPNLYLNIAVRNALEGVCALNVELLFYPSKEGSPRSHTMDFKLVDPMKPASPQVRGDRVVFYIQVESRYLDALKKDEVLPFDSFVPGIEPSLVVLCSSIEDSVVVAEHFRRVLPQIVGFNVIPNPAGKNFQSSSVFQLRPDEAIVSNGIVFGFKRVKQSSEWNVDHFLAGRD
jgi:hypothetical protein